MARFRLPKSSCISCCCNATHNQLHSYSVRSQLNHQQTDPRSCCMMQYLPVCTLETDLSLPKSNALPRVAIVMVMNSMLLSIKCKSWTWDVAIHENNTSCRVRKFLLHPVLPSVVDKSTKVLTASPVDAIVI